MLDELKDTPNLLAGRAPGLTSTMSSTEMKLKKDVRPIAYVHMHICTCIYVHAYVLRPDPACHPT